MLTTLGNVPSYYLSYFYAHDRHVRESIGAPTRGQRVAEIEATLLEMYRDVSLVEKPALLGERGGAYYSEAAVGLIAALHGLDPDGVHSVNVRNNGTLPFLPDHAVIEVSARAGLDGPVALPVTPLAPDLAGLVTPRLGVRGAGHRRRPARWPRSAGQADSARTGQADSARRGQADSAREVTRISGARSR